jgi:DNA-binding response OmpR family regulator
MINKKILVVEDEKILREAIIKKLEKEGFVVIGAENGQEALTMVSTKKPDMILLDIIMPVLDGVSVFKLLKAKEETKSIPIVFLTNVRNDEKRITEILQTGGTEILVKVDYSLEEVVKIIKTVLRLD